MSSSGLILLQFKNAPKHFSDSIINGFQYNIDASNQICVTSQSITVLPNQKILTSANYILKYILDKEVIKVKDMVSMYRVDKQDNRA
jgi:hypothetical protein